jgi:hypothetical protein
MQRNAIGFGVALFTFIIGAGLANLWLYKSRSPELAPEANTPASPVSSVGSKNAKLIVGTWEGREPIVTRVKGQKYIDASVMYLTFGRDGTAVIDYSPGGGKKFVVPYKFKDERTIMDSHHPENLIIREEGDGAISFYPEGNRMRESIDMIYVYKFRKIR